MSKPKTAETQTAAMKLYAPRSAMPQPRDRAMDRVMPAGADPFDGGVAWSDDVDAFRVALMRKMMTAAGYWRDCVRPDCRRAKVCHNPQHCRGEPEYPPLTEEETAQRMHEFQQALRARVAELEAARGGR